MIDNISVSSVLLSVFLILISFILLDFYKKRRLCYYAAKVPGPLALPLIGSGYLFLGSTKNHFKTLRGLLDQYNPICKLWMAGKLLFVLTNPEDAQLVLNKFLEREEGYKYLKPVFGNGVFTSSVKEWKNHRKVIVSTFNQHVLNSFVDIFNTHSKTLTKKLPEEKHYIDIFPVLAQCTLDIMCHTVMGTEMNELRGEKDFIVWMTRVAKLSITRMANAPLWSDFVWNLLPMSRESKNLDRKIQEYVRRVIEMRRQKENYDVEQRKILLDHLLDREDWTDEELTNETRSVIMAGSDATALTLAYCLMMLGMHQDIQRRVFEEILSVFGGSDRDVTVEDLTRLDYLDRFIKETLRLFPVGSIIGRQLTQDCVLGGYVLPKGSSIGVAILHIHRDAKYWPEPLKFDPDRFLPEEVAKRHPCSYLPFSIGHRSCLGFKFASMVMKVVLATILRSYKVASTKYTCVEDIRVKMEIATKCIDGYPVKLQRLQ